MLRKQPTYDHAITNAFLPFTKRLSKTTKFVAYITFYEAARRLFRPLPPDLQGSLSASSTLHGYTASTRVVLLTWSEKRFSKKLLCIAYVATKLMSQQLTVT